MLYHFCFGYIIFRENVEDNLEWNILEVRRYLRGKLSKIELLFIKHLFCFRYSIIQGTESKIRHHFSFFLLFEVL